MRLGLFLALLSVILLGSCAFNGPQYQGPPSDYFDGAKFHNLVPIQRDFSSYLKWFTDRNPGKWSHLPLAPIGPPPPRRVTGSRLRVTHVNHSTVLLQTRGMNILTDPIWSDTAGPITYLGARRWRPPGLHFEDLPPIDVVIVSHAHYDHLDLPTLARLAESHNPRIFVGLGLAPLLKSHRIDRVTEMDWWQSERIGPGLQVTAVPVQHWSSRSLFDRNETLWAGYVIETPDGPLYFAGDTGMGPHFELTRERFGRPRLALLPIGAYLPRWFMKPVHISPREALEAHEILGALRSMAVHYGTFRLGEDGQFQGRDRFLELAEARGLRRQVLTPPFGFGEEISELADTTKTRSGIEGSRQATRR